MLVGANVQNGERIEKLRRATAAHTAYMSKAVDGQGCDRHILGTGTHARTLTLLCVLATHPGRGTPTTADTRHEARAQAGRNARVL